MADAYWRYPETLPAQSQVMVPTPVKRHRSDYEIPAGHEIPSYYPRGDDRTLLSVKDSESIAASYDRYLRSVSMPSLAIPQTQPARPAPGMPSLPADAARVPGYGNMDPMVAAAAAAKERTLVGGPMADISLPPDASSTLFVEGVPLDTTCREVSHIFRPFLGYKEVRLVNKEQKRSGGSSQLLCFVDFASPAHSATALDALQGYKFDEDDRDSPRLKLQFARFPGSRSGGGYRGRR